MSDYVDYNGNAITRDQIEAAFAGGRARLVHGRKIEGGTSTSLAIDGDDWDNRGQPTMMSAEWWTRTPTTVEECLAAAR